MFRKSLKVATCFGLDKQLKLLRPGEEGGYDVNFGDPWTLGLVSANLTGKRLCA